jgi:hypothetical protein
MAPRACGALPFATSTVARLQLAAAGCFRGSGLRAGGEVQTQTPEKVSTAKSPRAHFSDLPFRDYSGDLNIVDWFGW